MFELFDRIIEHKTGDYRCPPFQSVDWPYQPYTTMQVLDYLREMWIEKLEYEYEQLKNRK